MTDSVKPPEMHARVVTANTCTSCVAQSVTDNAHELWVRHGRPAVTSSLTQEQRLLNELRDRTLSKARRLLPRSAQIFGADEEHETAEEGRLRVEARRAGLAQYEARQREEAARQQEAAELRKRHVVEAQRFQRLKRAIQRNDHERVRSILHAAAHGSDLRR